MLTRTEPSKDNPGVVVLPPVLYGGAFLFVMLLQWAWPLTIMGHVPALWLGFILLVVSLSLAIWGRKTMHGAGTNISPLKPAMSLVTSGPYRFTRNPLYVAMTLLYLGLILLLDSLWGVFLLVPVLLILH